MARGGKGAPIWRLEIDPNEEARYGTRGAMRILGRTPSAISAATSLLPTLRFLAACGQFRKSCSLATTLVLGTVGPSRLTNFLGFQAQVQHTDVLRFIIVENAY